MKLPAELRGETIGWAASLRALKVEKSSTAMVGKESSGRTGGSGEVGVEGVVGADVEDVRDGGFEFSGPPTAEALSFLLSLLVMLVVVVLLLTFAPEPTTFLLIRSGDGTSALGLVLDCLQPISIGDEEAPVAVAGGIGVSGSLPNSAARPCVSGSISMQIA